ncbi:MAG: 2'-5' RNA ligase family protein [Actinomycetota bacterium]|nr:2'-5' RNA ligase family protein [Actinomycetota bacterium]
MVHSVELLFDPAAEAAVRDLWTALADAGIRSLAGHTSPSNRPHVTLTVAEHMDGAVDDALCALLDRLPLSCLIGAPTLFGGGRTVTLVRMVVPSAGLLGLQADVHRVCLPHMADGPLPHAAPGRWSPHVTLARRLPAGELATALGQPGMFGDIAAAAVGLRHWDGDGRVEHLISR